MTVRSRRSWLALSSVLGGAVLLLAAGRDARADDETGVLMTGHHQFESPQNFDIELRFSPYTPRVDYDPSLTGNPYTSTFGTAPRLEFAAELAAERGYAMVESFHEKLLMGTGTYAKEFLEGTPPLDTVYVPIGLGSSICGMAAAKVLVVPGLASSLMFGSGDL